MAGIGDRISGWVEERRAAWGDALGRFLLERIAGGVTRSLEDMEPGAIEGYQAFLKKLVDDPNVPEELKVFYRKALTTGNPFSSIGAVMVMVLQSFGVLLGGSQPLSNIMRYEQDQLLKTSRLDPLSAINAWRRDPAKYADIFSDLADQGWDESRIEALKFITQFIPNADEQTLWLAREVFEPDMITKYGLDDELPDYANTDFSKIGVTPEQMTNKWRAHWQHASWIQVVEMLHRGLIIEADVYDWFRLVEIPPFWRKPLTQMAYTWPTRVDVRRWWDMRTITEDRLRELYSGMGYRGDNLDDYVTWTKVYVAFPDLLARWSNGWITLEEVRAELTALGMPAARVDEFIQAKVKAEQPVRTASERDITISDIYKGIRQEVITREQGIELLMELGFDEDEADYKITVNVPANMVETAVKVRQLTKSDIIAGLRAKVLTEDQARERLLAVPYNAADTQLLLDIFQASIKPPTEERQKQASKADIVLAVKKDLITAEEGYLMLIDLGFTPEASEFILLVKAESSPFSPVTFGEFKDQTAKWRKAAGMTTPAFDDKLREAADDLVRISDEVKSLEEAVRAEEFTLVDQDVIPDETEKKLKDLQVALNRARAERERKQSEYNTLAAKFKQATE